VKPLSSSYISILRAYAIIAVLIIHFLWLFGWDVFYNSTTRFPAVALDQLVRFCVPLFIGISGYTLMLGYGKGKFPILKFFSRRILKILPLYLLWSAIYVIQGWIISNQIPSISQLPSQTLNFLSLLLKGQSYYHLYFVPLIIQLYLLFPILRISLNTKPHLTLALATIFQTGFYIFLFLGRLTQSSALIFNSDYHQYVLFISFIGYFVLGMYLTKFKITQTSFLTKTLILGLILTIIDSYLSITQGYSPLLSTTYTRLSMMPLLYPLIILLFQPNHIMKFQPQWLIWLGNQSYLIFLAHAAFLRILVASYQQPTLSLLPALILPLIILIINLRPSKG